MIISGVVVDSRFFVVVVWRVPAALAPPTDGVVTVETTA